MVLQRSQGFSLPAVQIEARCKKVGKAAFAHYFNNVFIIRAYAQACGAVQRPLYFGFHLNLSVLIRLRILLVKIFHFARRSIMERGKRAMRYN